MIDYRQAGWPHACAGLNLEAPDWRSLTNSHFWRHFRNLQNKNPAAADGGSRIRNVLLKTAMGAYGGQNSRSETSLATESSFLIQSLRSIMTTGASWGNGGIRAVRRPRAAPWLRRVGSAKWVPHLAGEVHSVDFAVRPPASRRHAQKS